MIINTNELIGAPLNWAVANATKAWEWMHAYFPTMTLDPTFSGVEAFVFNGGRCAVRLVPNNPFRQDYQIIEPSSDWALGGPLIEKYGIKLIPYQWHVHDGCEKWFAVCSNNTKVVQASHKEPLVAAMRALVLAVLGEAVDIPKELCRHDHD